MIYIYIYIPSSSSSLLCFQSYVECFNQIIAEDNTGVINPEDAKLEEVEKLDRMEEGW